MGKAGKQKRSAVRRAAKKARKTANYLRCGPKDTSRQKRRKKYGCHKSSNNGKLYSPRPGKKARRRVQGLALPSKKQKRNRKCSNYPLRPKRQR